MFEQLLEKIARALDEAGLNYMVIGGQAVLLYGEPRLTKDIDITLGAAPDRLEDVLHVVQRMQLEPLVDASFVEQTMVLPCEDPTTGIRVDFIFSMSPYEQQALRRVRHVGIGTASVRFASLEDVIIHKVIAGRPRDLEDVKSMLLKNSEVEVEYIRRWLEAFSDTLAQPLEERFEAVWEQIR